MTPKRLEQFKKSLLEEKKRIEKELNEIAEKRPQENGGFDVRFPQYGTSKDENAQEVAEFEKLKVIETSLEERLTQINETLKKTEEEGKFGICESCSEEIEEPRLKAVPTAALCSFCAKRA